MALHPPQYNLTLDQAIERLREEAAKNETQKDTPQLQGMSPDEGYNVGYATAIHDLVSLTGPNPREVGVIEVTYAIAEDPE